MKADDRHNFTMGQQQPTPFDRSKKLKRLANAIVFIYPLRLISQVIAEPSFAIIDFF